MLEPTEYTLIGSYVYVKLVFTFEHQADLAQLGERETEDLKVPCSIHGIRIFFLYFLVVFSFSSIVSMISFVVISMKLS